MKVKLSKKKLSNLYKNNPPVEHHEKLDLDEPQYEEFVQPTTAQQTVRPIIEGQIFCNFSIDPIKLYKFFECYQHASDV